ncbi:phage coat protein [Salmonella enterica subsp. enterica serovar Chomedey]|nr:phage coat protein [Salmonella enterica subsp. enterica serovar Chomedey]
MFVFSKSLGEKTGNLAVNSYQFEMLKQERDAALNHQGVNVMKEIANRINAANQLNGINAVRSPADLYKAFDQTVLRQFEPTTEFTLFNDLMPLSRSVRINQTVYEYAKSGGRMWAHTSMSGQIGAALDAVQYEYDGTMVPVHDTGFKFHWRDPRLNNPDAFDIISDAQFESTNEVRRQYVDYAYNGYRDAAGNYVTFDGKTWKGLKNDERVQMVDLDASGLNIDFTSASATSQQIRDAAIKLRDTLKITNNQYAEQTWYVSAEIMSNLERYYSDNYQSGTILQELLKLSGISAIKEDAQLKGNQILIVPLTAGVIAPIVGQAFGTVADPRPHYNSDYIWRTWGAAGLMVKTDINSKKSVIYASS